MTATIIRPNKNRGRTTIWLLSGMLFLQLLAFPRSIYLWSGINDEFTPEQISSIYLDDYINLLATLNFLLYIVTVIFYLRWFKRAYHNIRQFGHKLRYSSGMSVGAWFIPIFHWIGPIQMMLELFKRTDETLEQYGLKVRKTGRFLVISLWWVLYVAGGLQMLYFTIFPVDYPMSPELAKPILGYSIIINLLNTLLTVMAILVVVYYRRLELKLSMIPNVSIQSTTEESLDVIDQGMNS